MIYLIQEEQTVPTINKPEESINIISKLIEDNVDIQLEKIDGRIPREFNPQL